MHGEPGLQDTTTGAESHNTSGFANQEPSRTPARFARQNPYVCSARRRLCSTLSSGRKPTHPLPKAELTRRGPIALAARAEARVTFQYDHVEATGLLAHSESMCAALGATEQPTPALAKHNTLFAVRTGGRAPVAPRPRPPLRFRRLRVGAHRPRKTARSSHGHIVIFDTCHIAAASATSARPHCACGSEETAAAHLQR